MKRDADSISEEKREKTMIYFDNSATTLRKPAEVAEAVRDAILTMGNASRGAHDAALSGMRGDRDACGPSDLSRLRGKTVLDFRTCL